MARIRSIHPGIWTDEAFVSVSRDARLLFIGILNECDDQGAFEWKPLQIKMRLTAGDDAPVATVSAWLAELASADLVRRFEVKGALFGAVRNFCHWQRPKKPNSIYPMPPEFRTYAGPKPKSSEPHTSDDDDGSELGEAEVPEVPNQFPTNGEIPPQMEDGGDKGKEEVTPKPPRGPKSMTDDPDCAAFYAAYPRHDAPDDAFKAWRQVIKGGAKPAAIMAGLARYSFPTERQFIKLPASWLRAGCWKADDGGTLPLGRPTGAPMPVSGGF